MEASEENKMLERQEVSEQEEPQSEESTDVLQDLDIDLEEITNFSEEAKKAFDAGPEILIELPHDKIVDELREKQKLIEEAFNKLIQYRDEMLSRLREERSHRDEYNAKVKDISSKMRELVAKKRELQSYIEEKKKELNELRKTLREINEQLESLQRDVEGFSLRKEKRLRREIIKYEKMLETFNLPPEIEDRIVKKIQELSAQLRSFKEKEEKWKEINRLRKEREKLRDNIGALRKALVLYIQELKKIRQEIKELRKERDYYKSKADGYHKKVEEYRKKLDRLKEILNTLRDVRYRVYKTLNRLRKLKQQMRHFKAEEEFKQVVLRRLEEIRGKIERGVLEMPDLQFLINFGFLTEDIFEQLVSTSPQELAKKVAEELGYK